MPSKSKTLPELEYRPDISGLRAIAVLGVLLFHFKIAAFRGGFVGVDIFFVISGYLISRQILERSAAGRFSFLEFYARRMSRILPALIFTVVVTFICGLLWLSPEFMRGLAKESTHALLSISNIQYWREANAYFAPKSDQLALLHFWSLSLEEQFYLVWPAFLIFALRFFSAARIIAVTAIISWLGAWLWSMRDSEAVFFLMPFRIFEFGVGALVIFAERRFVLKGLSADLMFSAGLTSIIFSVLAFDPNWPLLGCAVALPSLGTAAIIQAGSASRLSPLLTNRAFLGIGAISYSLYLCHWPILFFARFIFGDVADSLAGTLMAAAATFIVAVAMYRFVEQPFRHRRGGPQMNYRSIVANYLGCIAAFAFITHIAFRQDGWAWRLSKDQVALVQLQSFGSSPCAFFGNRQCAFGILDKPIGVELVGDSYIQHYVSGLDPILTQLNLRGETSTVGGCPILTGIASRGPRAAECIATRDAVFSRLAKTTVPVIYGLAWQGYIDDLIVSENDAAASRGNGMNNLRAGLEATIREIGKNGRRIMLVGAQVINSCKIDRSRLLPGPLWHAPPKECAAVTKEAALQQGAAVNDMLRDIQKKFPRQVTLLIPAEYLCDATCVVTRNGVWLYQDEGHFTVAGSRYIGTRAESSFKKFLMPAPK